MRAHIILTIEDACRVRMESCLGDWNHDDPFEAWDRLPLYLRARLHPMPMVIATACRPVSGLQNLMALVYG